jgi:hypothetical protein
MRRFAILTLCAIALNFGTGLNGCDVAARFDVEYYVPPEATSRAGVRVAVLDAHSGRTVDVPLSQFEQVENVADLFREKR